MFLNKPVIKNILLLLLLATASPCFAQDLHFSQFFETPLLRNPGLAGLYNGDTRVQGVYRDQWNSVANAYRTGSVNGEMKFAVGRGNDFVTPSVQILYDRAGTIGWTSTHILPGVNYHKSLSDEKNSYLSLGVMGGVIQRRFDPSKMTTNSQFENGGIGENLAQPQYTYFDGSVGMSYNAGLNDNQDNNYYLGAAYHHFNRPKQSFYRNPNIELNGKWVFSGGLRLAVGDYARATFMADHSFQGAFTETVFGGSYGVKIGGYPDDYDYFLEAGAFIRWNDAFIPVIKLEYKPFTVSFSYDVNISQLRTSSYGRGGFEIGVTYTAFRLKNSTAEYLRCPRF